MPPLNIKILPTLSLMAVAATLTACGSSIFPGGSQLGANANAAGSSAGSASCGNANGATGNGSNTAGNGNTVVSKLPEAWTLVAGSQGYFIDLSTANGAFWGGLASDENHDYRSVDGGNTWTQLVVDSNRCYVGTPTADNNIAYGHCFPVGSDPEITSPIVGTTRDGGNTWENLTYAFAMDATDPTNPNVAYAHEAHKGTVNFPGSYVTRNAGATWTPLSSEPNELVNAVGPTGDDIYAGGFVGLQVYVDASHDGGVTWTRVPVQGDNVTLIPATSTTVYANLTDKELDVSRDGGKSFNTIYPSCVTQAQVTPWDPNFVLATPCGASGAALQWVATTDGGGSWEIVTPPQGCTALNGFAFDKATKTLTAVCANALYEAVSQ